MRRSVLLTLAALGALVSLIGGAGLFSALTDTARTGTNSAESGALAASADIQLATANVVPGPLGELGHIQCGTFAENLTTGLFTVSGVGPGYSSDTTPTYLCVRNVGSQSVALGFGADELVETDFACTGDEALNGDLTCGGDQAGELGGVLQASLTKLVQCEQGVPLSEHGNQLSGLAAAPTSLGSLNPGGTECFSASLRTPPITSVAANDLQRAQSDRVTWRFRFDAQAE